LWVFVLRFWFQPARPPKPKKRTFWSGETCVIYTHNSNFQWELPYPIPQWQSILIRSHIPFVNFLHHVKSWYFHNMLPNFKALRVQILAICYWFWLEENIILYIERL
jgi:hypothetical protein